VYIDQNILLDLMLVSGLQCANACLILQLDLMFFYDLMKIYLIITGQYSGSFSDFVHASGDSKNLRKIVK